MYDDTYSITRRDPNEFSYSGHAAEYDQNDTDVPVTYSVSWSWNATISLSVSASGQVDASVIVASVQGTLGVTASSSISISGTHTTTVTVPPHSHVYIAYGVWRVATAGTYHRFAENPGSGCANQSYSAYARTPSFAGWHTWQ